MKEAIITSSVLILCIVLLRRLCKGRISAGLQYALWLLVAVRLIMPGITAVFPDLLPESGLSIMNVADKVETAVQDHIQPIELPVQINLNLSTGDLPFLNTNDGPTAVFVAGRIGWTWIDFFKGIWYFGMVVVCVWMTAVNIRFMHKLYKRRAEYMYDKEDGEQDYRLPVYLAKELPSPCLYGIPGRLAVYLPEDVADDKEKVRHILAHEYCHYKHRDVFWSMLRCILVTVYWFHPLVWLAAVLSKQDCELACDEAAIKALGEEERLAYGKTLVALITRKTRASDIVCAATTMTAGTESIKERVRRIAEKPRRLVIALVLALVAAGTAVVFTFTQAKAEGYPEGAFLIDGENSQMATTDCFQLMFPDSFIDKAYYRIVNSTDIVVYHKDSSREIGRFCRMTYGEATRLADMQEVALIKNYGANEGLRCYIAGEEYTQPKSQTQHYYTPDTPASENSSGREGVPGTDSNNGGTTGVPGTDSNHEETEGVPGTDSNSDGTTYLLEEHQVSSGGGLVPIPAPEEVEAKAEKMPYIEGSDLNSVNERRIEETPKFIPIESTGDTEDATNEEAGNAENNVSVEYLPAEQITVTGVPVDDAYCYLYVPADNTDADDSFRTELLQMNQILTELTESVTVLYLSTDSIQEILDVLIENRTPYVGDATKTSTIARTLPTTSDLSCQYVEMETDAEPYAVTIRYQKHVDNSTPIDDDILFMNAVLLFASIENVQQCNMRMQDMVTEYGAVGGLDLEYTAEGYSVISYEREEMEELFGTLYPCSETKDDFVDLYNRVLEYLKN